MTKGQGLELSLSPSWWGKSGGCLRVGCWCIHRLRTRNKCGTQMQSMAVPCGGILGCPQARTCRGTMHYKRQPLLLRFVSGCNQRLLPTAGCTNQLRSRFQWPPVQTSAQHPVTHTAQPAQPHNARAFQDHAFVSCTLTPALTHIPMCCSTACPHSLGCNTSQQIQGPSCSRIGGGMGNGARPAPPAL